MKIPVHVSIAVSGLSIVLGAVLFDQIEAERQERVFLERELQEATNSLFVTENGFSPSRASQNLITDLLNLSQTDDEAKRIVSKYKLKEEGQLSAPAQIPQGTPRI
jgi:hypothetical protein